MGRPWDRKGPRASSRGGPKARRDPSSFPCKDSCIKIEEPAWFGAKYLENTLPYAGSSAYWAIFLGVLAEYIGLPFPSSILLILGGALSYEGRLNPLIILVLASVAASVGDAIWFTLGRGRGMVFLNGYCRLSLGSRDCVRRTEEFFLRFPGLSLVIGKFVPGLSTFVVPIAGYSGMRYPDFLRFDGVGILLWVTLMMVIGYWSGESVNTLLGSLKESRSVLLVLAAVFVLCFYAVKLWRLKRFGRAEINEE